MHSATPGCVDELRRRPHRHRFTASGTKVARNALLVGAGGKLQVSVNPDLGLSKTGGLSSDFT